MAFEQVVQGATQPVVVEELQLLPADAQQIRRVPLRSVG
jgi:hypothetical protein